MGMSPSARGDGKPDPGGGQITGAGVSGASTASLLAYKRLAPRRNGSANFRHLPRGIDPRQHSDLPRDCRPQCRHADACPLDRLQRCGPARGILLPGHSPLITLQAGDEAACFSLFDHRWRPALQRQIWAAWGPWLVQGSRPWRSHRLYSSC